MGRHPAQWGFEVKPSASEPHCIEIELTAYACGEDRLIARHHLVIPWGPAAGLADALAEVILDHQAVAEEHRENRGQTGGA
jgi:hypothetical protein